MIFFFFGLASGTVCFSADISTGFSTCFSLFISGSFIIAFFVYFLLIFSQYSSSTVLMWLGTLTPISDRLSIMSLFSLPISFANS